MNTNPTAFAEFESTYAMLLRSEERERTASEFIVYALLILCTVFSIWQLAHQPITVPTNLIHSTSVTQSANTPRASV
ncbi:MAG: hypothetical protein M3Y86_01665 [Verrucomicrobiota bacterium]|nr:hypothetical protein [Verrucomicrobiota bacterium]